MNRRGWVMGGVAATAALAGGGLAWWRLQPHAIDSGAESAWWGLSFDTPQGDSTLAMASRTDATSRPVSSDGST